MPSIKEQVLDILRDIVLTLKTHGNDLKTDKNFRDKWIEKKKKLDELIPLLSEDDYVWLDKEYNIWIKEIIKDVDPRIIALAKNNS